MTNHASKWYRVFEYSGKSIQDNTNDKPITWFDILLERELEIWPLELYFQVDCWLSVSLWEEMTSLVVIPFLPITQFQLYNKYNFIWLSMHQLYTLKTNDSLDENAIEISHGTVFRDLKAIRYSVHKNKLYMIS